MNYLFTSRHLTLDNLSRSNQGRMTFKMLYLLNGASYWILRETHIHSKSYMIFQFTPWHLTLGDIERSNQGNCVFIGLCIIDNVSLDSGAVRPRGLLLLSWRIFDIMTNFLSSWHIFVIISGTKYHENLFLTSWNHFDVMTNFLTSWQSFDVMTYFWLHGELLTYFLRNDELFGVMTCFWHHDELFDVMTFFEFMTNFLASWRTFWHHDEPFDVMANFLTSWCTFCAIKPSYKYITKYIY